MGGLWVENSIIATFEDKDTDHMYIKIFIRIAGHLEQRGGSYLFFLLRVPVLHHWCFTTAEGSECRCSWSSTPGVIRG